MSTVGYTTIGGTTETGSALQKKAWQIVAPIDFWKADEFWVYLDRSVAGSGFQIDVAIYTDDGGSPNSPSALVANSGITLNANIAQNTPAWYSIAYSTKPILLSGQTYWLALIMTKASKTFYDANPKQVVATATDTPPFDDPFGAISTRQTRQASAYLVYTPATQKTGSVTISGTATVPSTARIKIKNASVTISGSSAAACGYAVDLQPIDETRTLQWMYKPAASPSTLAQMMACRHLILTKGDESATNGVTALRQAGYQEPIIDYVRGEAIQNPGAGSPKNNQVAWNAGDWNDIDTNHPDWFLYDAKSPTPLRILASQSATDYWMMDWANTGWQQYFIAKMKTLLAANQFNGVFMDNIELSLAKREQEGAFIPPQFMSSVGGSDHTDAYGNGYNQAASDTLYRTAVKSFLTAIKKGIPGIVLGNLINLRPETAWAEYIAILDGGMNEATFADWHTSYLSTTAWQNDLALAIPKKHIIFISQADDQFDTTRQSFCYCSYLLVCNPLISFRHTSAASYNQWWAYSNYDIALGDPLGAYTGPVANVYTRLFRNGYVTVNQSTHASQIVLYKFGTVSVSGTATTAATGRRMKFGAVTTSGTATTVATGTKSVGGAGAAIIFGSSNVTAAGIKIKIAVAASSGSATVAGASTRIRSASVAIQGDCSVPGVVATKYKTSTVTMSGTATVAPATATKAVQAVFGQLTGNSVVNGTGIRRVVSRGGSVSGTAQTFGNGLRTRMYATGYLEPKVTCRH